METAGSTRTVDAPSINAFKSRLVCVTVRDIRMGFFMD